MHLLLPLLHLSFPLISLISLLPITQACLTYHAEFPFDNDKPFIGKIIDNGVETCWINMSYNEHWKWQAMENEKDWGRREWVWKPWPFTCTKKQWEGKMKNNATDRSYSAELGVGLRGVTYRAHGVKFWFNPDTVEDVEGDRVGLITGVDWWAGLVGEFDFGKEGDGVEYGI
ncbi:predicted protein [Sclerotinia sclerotiorum 1980 UF-70]|uniref:Uncharacterized protein n=1 Tax=Sclerotinia sclerotiorum (strain ATCC 18683 / 1980 / Ss-1) TaxID=665079 RepID=A7E4W3_SCLS1|nr:predicted protein [Sclerotinia sclerotiorum 1980 UF-70]EDN90935.1 predicted protein [Sclerotinia sclerotiorum 1980 UF-70]